MYVSDLFVLSWERGWTNEAGNYLFRAANVVVDVCAVFCYCLLCLWHFSILHDLQFVNAVR